MMARSKDSSAQHNQRFMMQLPRAIRDRQGKTLQTKTMRSDTCSPSWKRDRGIKRGSTQPNC